MYRYPLELDVPEGLAGRSFLPALRGQHGRPHGTVSGFMDNWRTYVLGRWKIIERPRGRTRVFDLNEDPDENTPLDAPITRAALRRQMGAALDRTQPTRRRRRAPQATIDREMAEQLRALGYVE
ncbi:MAG: hypothetical protein AAF411_21360 [Myxococcota bacterium]